MKAIILALCLVLLSGCATTYAITADPETGKITGLTIKSYREFAEKFLAEYDREAGSLKIETGGVTTAVSPLENAAAQLMLMLPGILTATPVP